MTRSSLSEQRLAERRIFFGPLADALAAVGAPGPVALVGSPRSLRLVPERAFGETPVRRYEGARAHNPRASVEGATALVEEHGCRTIAAIGGSSAIDLGKAAAADRDVLLIAIPTALGGAEMSRGYGVRDDDRKTSARLATPPEVVIYDPALLATLPPRELGSIGINAYAHAIEASYAHIRHALGAGAAIAAGRALPPLLLRAAQQAQRDEALHAALFEAAHLAGFALDARSMGLHHAVCHVVGGLTGIPHGIVNAIVLPHAIRANAAVAPAAVTAVAAAFGVDDPAAEAERIAAAYDLPRSFAELGAAEDLVERATPRVLQSPLLRNNPARVTPRLVEGLLAAAYGRS